MNNPPFKKGILIASDPAFSSATKRYTPNWKLRRSTAKKNVKHKPTVEDLGRLKESGAHKPISKFKSFKGNQQNQQQPQQSGPTVCAMIFEQQTSQGTTSDSTSQPCSRAAKLGKFTSLSRSIKQNDIHVELKLTPHLKALPCRTAYFEHFFGFRWNFDSFL